MDRKVVLAFLLMLVVAVAPAVLFKRTPKPPAGAVRPDTGVAVVTPPSADTLRRAVEAGPETSSAAGSPPEAGDSIQVSSPLYAYVFSARGGILHSATLERYKAMAPADRGKAAQLLTSHSDLQGLTLRIGRDSIVPLKTWNFTPSTRSLRVSASEPLTLTATRGGMSVELQYRFQPDNYLIDVQGRIQGLGPEGGLLLVGMGPGLRNTESDSVEHTREVGVVTKDQKSDLTRFQSLKPNEVTPLSGPFEWVAVKSKYFVTGLLAFDTTTAATATGGISGVSAKGIARSPDEKPVEADVQASIQLSPAGQFHYRLYVGPMEYPRLKAIGHDFDDVNPYGWPGFRTIIRPVAVAARWLLVSMHESLHLAYGLGLVMFGILIRIVLWPLNQKAMRASLQMQAIQPLLKGVQDRHKNDPQKLQQETFKLYREHKVNPFGGCWPMLLPWPVLISLFFVFQNSIELRGEPFLWLPDLARADPLLITPILMGLSMFVLSKVGQIGIEPNPQMKMMLYIMPVMMTVLFLKFASGLNLYYLVSNLVSIPQQWFVAKERLKRNPPSGTSPPVVAKR